MGSFKLTDNEIYCMYAYDWEKYRVEKYDMAGNELETFFFSKPAENEYMEFINIAEGKIYYMICTDKGNKNKVTFRCMDMETEKDEQVFSYCHSERFSKRNYLMMQEKEIYCWQNYFSDEYRPVMQLYVLTSTGGEMESIGNEAIYDFAYNTDYYFYVDRKHKLHRINRKTKKDNVISDIKVTEVKCTEDGLYVKEYDSWFDNGGFEWANMDYSRTLYFMDFDGENVKRIAKGKRGHIDY